MDLRERTATALAEARRRTEELLAPVDEPLLRAQQDPLQSPLLWDYAHIGVFEELWLVSTLAGTPPLDAARLHVYDAFENPRHIRAGLPLLGLAEATAYRDEVRRRALSLLEEADLESGDDPLLRDGYVYSMIVQHEHQHDETILQTLQLLEGGYLPRLPAEPRIPDGRTVVRDMVPVPAGVYPVGTDDHAPYDNEHPAHAVRLAAFAIDRFPVTCGDMVAFIDDGGYARTELWSAEGAAWLAESRATAPKHWVLDGGRWWTDRFGHRQPVRLDTPVMHVCYHEAEAWARWAGKRLPTEQEWEVAATWDPDRGSARRYPWGDAPPEPRHANLDQRLFGCAPAGAYPDGASALGVEQLIGDVWEWTSSHFGGYPGFGSFPYREYSEVFFGPEYRVLRGASWAARPSVARATFRNWDYPIRRQIFAGFRCVRDER